MVGNHIIHVPSTVDVTTFPLVHSCSTLPFYYTFQPTCNLTKALYDASPIIKNLKEKLKLYYIHT